MQKKIFMLVGAPDSGKTTFGKFVEELIGRENCCHIPIQDLSKRFQVTELFGKKVCINMDVPDGQIKDTGIIKQLSGNDVISAEKKYEPPFSFINECKLLYGANNMPKILNTDNAKAFFNRLVIIPFSNSIPANKQDKQLISKLLNEKNYIINEALKAFYRLVKNNYVFSSSYKSNRLSQDYINDCNNVIEFVNEKCTIGNKRDNKLKTYTHKLHEAYLEYCYERGYDENSIVNKVKLSSIIKDNFDVKSSRWREKDEDLRGFIGIVLKE